MKIKGLFAGAVAATMVVATQSHATAVGFWAGGSGIVVSGPITYEADPVVGDPANAFAITDVGGGFSDSNVGLGPVRITGVEAISPLDPPQGAPFPNSFSYYTVTNPTPPDTAISYDNLFYPDGASPDVCPGYPLFGGFLDIYGVIFTLSNGDSVDLYSNGGIPGVVPISYGAVIIDSTDTVIDNVAGGINASVPEPGSLLLLGSFLVGAAAFRRR